MNIVQVSPGELRIPPEKGGGIEQYVLNISRYLSLIEQSNVTILDRKFSPTDPDVEYIDGVRVVRLKARRFNLGLLRRFSDFTKLGFPVSFINMLLNQIAFGRQVKKYLATTDFDIVNVHSSIITIFLGMTSPQIKENLFFTCHATRSEKRSPTWQDKMAFAVEGKAVKCSRKVIVPSDEMRERLIAVTKVNLEHVLSIPVGVDTNTFNPSLDVGDVRQRYALEGKFNILFVGVISQRKGIEYLIKAANIVVNDFSYENTQFVLVGPLEGFGTPERKDSPYLNRIKYLIKSYGLQQKVILTGAVPVDDLRKLYAACDIFVLPSLAEMMATAILEAMASGKPVIATKVYGMSIQVRNGQSGFLIDLENEQQLADRIKYLVDNPEDREKMGAQGRKLAEEAFSWGRIAERLLELYEAGFGSN